MNSTRFPTCSFHPSQQQNPTCGPCVEDRGGSWAPVPQEQLGARQGTQDLLPLAPAFLWWVWRTSTQTTTMITDGKGIFKRKAQRLNKEDSVLFPCPGNWEAQVVQCSNLLLAPVETAQTSLWSEEENQPSH